MSEESENVGCITDQGMVEFGCTAKNHHLEFFVKDTGIGIPAEKQDAVFERFIQVDIFDKDARQGNGLGLSISKAYVDMLGGSIWFNSKLNAGSTFYFTIARYNKKKMEKDQVVITNEEEKINPAKKCLKVLIAEDDEFSFTLLNIMLSNVSKEILHAQTGLEAVDLARKNPDVDLILMDIKMPEMSGYEATEHIRKFDTNVIIIAQTAFVLANDKAKAIDAGCNDYLSKPIKEEELQLLMKKYFNLIN